MTAQPVGAQAVRLFECAECGRTYIADGETCLLCGRPTKEVAGEGNGRLTSWTTVFAVPSGDGPYVIGWADLDGAGVGVLGRVVGDASALRQDLPVTVRQTAGDDGWPRLWFELDLTR